MAKMTPISRMSAAMTTATQSRLDRHRVQRGEEGRVADEGGGRGPLGESHQAITMKTAMGARRRKTKGRVRQRQTTGRVETAKTRTIPEETKNSPRATVASTTMANRWSQPAMFPRSSRPVERSRRLDGLPARIWAPPAPYSNRRKCGAYRVFLSIPEPTVIVLRPATAA